MIYAVFLAVNYSFRMNIPPSLQKHASALTAALMRALRLDTADAMIQSSIVGLLDANIAARVTACIFKELSDSDRSEVATLLESDMQGAIAFLHRRIPDLPLLVQETIKEEIRATVRDVQAA